MYRTLLFAPGNHPRRVEKVFSVGADGVILDLEDACAIEEKAATRPVVVEALKKPRNCLGYVRVNDITTPFFHGDVMEVTGPHLDGFVVPMVNSATDLKIADWLIAQAEREKGMEIGSIDVIPILETAQGILNAEEIAGAVPRVKRIAFGAGDFCFDTNMYWSSDGQELVWARHKVVLASRAARREAPLDTVFPRLQETEAFEHDCRTGRRLGFQGRMCIHPSQVPTANEVYSPSPEEIAWSREVVETFREEEAKGSASFQIRGIFIDYPILYQAQRVLETAEKLGLPEAPAGKQADRQS